MQTFSNKNLDSLETKTAGAVGTNNTDSYNSVGSIVLKEELDVNYEPTLDEIHEYAQFLGMDPAKEPELLWIARQGLLAPLPPEWRPCQTTDGQVYYFNFSTGESIWDHPCDEIYKTLYQTEKAKLLQEKEQTKFSPDSAQSAIRPSQTKEQSQLSVRTPSPPTRPSSSISSSPENEYLNAKKILPDASPSVIQPKQDQERLSIDDIFAKLKPSETTRPLSKLSPIIPSGNIAAIDSKEIEQIKQNHQEQVEKLRADFSRQLNELCSDHENTMREERGRQQQDLKRLADDFQNRRQQEENRMDQEMIEWQHQQNQEIYRRQQQELQRLESEFNDKINQVRVDLDSKFASSSAEASTRRLTLDQRRAEMELESVQELEKLKLELEQSKQKQLSVARQREVEALLRMEQEFTEKQSIMEREHQQKIKELTESWDSHFKEIESDMRDRYEKLKNDLSREQQLKLTQRESEFQRKYDEIEMKFHERVSALESRVAEKERALEARLDELRQQQEQVDNGNERKVLLQKQQELKFMIENNGSLLKEQQKLREELAKEDKELEQQKIKVQVKKEEVRKQEMELVEKSRDILSKQVGPLENLSKSSKNEKLPDYQDEDESFDDIDGNNDGDDIEDQAYFRKVHDQLDANMPVADSIRRRIELEERELVKTRRDIKKYKKEMEQRQHRLEDTRKQWRQEMEVFENDPRLSLNWVSPYEKYRKRKDVEVEHGGLPQPETERTEELEKTFSEVLSILRSDNVSRPRVMHLRQASSPMKISNSPAPAVPTVNIIRSAAINNHPYQSVSASSTVPLDIILPATKPDTFKTIADKWHQDRQRADQQLRSHSQWLHDFRQRIGLERTRTYISS